MFLASLTARLCKFSAETVFKICSAKSDVSLSLAFFFGVRPGAAFYVSIRM